jgi:hypothetical protein
MQLAAWELQVAWVVMCDVRAGIIPSDPDWSRFVTSCGRVEALAAEYRT